ncbi:adenylyl-sulfate kinase [Magnetovibrio sp. PR-2]|uniref:adenylyl-sulfate kinase n=1 Tax=Magnetovibrio sp. PR-2 TaxID=3120356 RepID=UPI003FA5A306
MSQNNIKSERAQEALARNIYIVDHRVDSKDQWQRTGHKGGVLWLTGLSGSGKSTVGLGLEQALHQLGYQAYVLDGDNVRAGLNKDLGFSPQDRSENIRRIAEVAALFAQSGTLVVTAFISPYQEDRDLAREVIGEGFHEIHVDASLDVCESRDPKGLYKRARAGEIPEFTGISAPYEAPKKAELVLNTGELDIEQSVHKLLDHIEDNFTLDDNRLRVVA